MAFDTSHTRRSREDWAVEPTRELLTAFKYFPTMELAHALYARLSRIYVDAEDGHTCPKCGHEWDT